MAGSANVKRPIKSAAQTTSCGSPSSTPYKPQALHGRHRLQIAAVASHCAQATEPIARTTGDPPKIAAFSIEVAASPPSSPEGVSTTNYGHPLPAQPQSVVDSRHRKLRRICSTRSSPHSCWPADRAGAPLTARCCAGPDNCRRAPQPGDGCARQLPVQYLLQVTRALCYRLQIAAASRPLQTEIAHRLRVSSGNAASA